MAIQDDEFLRQYPIKSTDALNYVEPLMKTFMGRGEVRGFLFNQLKRGQNAFIYEVDSGHGKQYEVFKKKIGKTFDQKRLKETYPTATQFGKWAISCATLEKAMEYFKKFEESDPLSIPELNNNQNTPNLGLGMGVF